MNERHPYVVVLGSSHKLARDVVVPALSEARPSRIWSDGGWGVSEVAEEYARAAHTVEVHVHWSLRAIIDDAREYVANIGQAGRVLVLAFPCPASPDAWDAARYAAAHGLPTLVWELDEDGELAGDAPVRLGA